MPEGAAFFLQAYYDVDTCRLDHGAIPWTAASLYAREAGLEPDVADMLWQLIKALGQADAKWHDEQPT